MAHWKASLEDAVLWSFSATQQSWPDTACRSVSHQTCYTALFWGLWRKSGTEAVIQSTGLLSGLSLPCTRRTERSGCPLHLDCAGDRAAACSCFSLSFQMALLLFILFFCWPRKVTTWTHKWEFGETNKRFVSLPFPLPKLCSLFLWEWRGTSSFTSKNYKFFCCCFVCLLQINFVACQLFALLAAFWFRIYLGPSHASSAVRHAFATLFGIYFAVFCFGWWVFNH